MKKIIFIVNKNEEKDLREILTQATSEIWKEKFEISLFLIDTTKENIDKFVAYERLTKKIISEKTDMVFSIWVTDIFVNSFGLYSDHTDFTTNALIIKKTTKFPHILKVVPSLWIKYYKLRKIEEVIILTISWMLENLYESPEESKNLSERFDD